MKKFICILVIATQLASCVTYENRAVSFRPPQEYINYQDASGLMVGAEAFVDRKLAAEAFGFDIRSAGIIPVQVVFDNGSGQPVEVVAGQTFLVDGSNRYWKVLASSEVVERVSAATEAGYIGGGAARGAAFGGAAGALLGLALGIASGRSVGSAVVTGGALGGAGGAVIGGAGRADAERLNKTKIASALHEKGIEGKALAAQTLASGFIYFPGEAETVKDLRLQVRYMREGAVRTLNLRLR